MIQWLGMAKGIFSAAQQAVGWGGFLVKQASPHAAKALQWGAALRGKLRKDQPAVDWGRGGEGPRLVKDAASQVHLPFEHPPGAPDYARPKRDWSPPTRGVGSRERAALVGGPEQQHLGPPSPPEETPSVRKVPPWKAARASREKGAPASPPKPRRRVETSVSGRTVAPVPPPGQETPGPPEEEGLWAGMRRKYDENLARARRRSKARRDLAEERRDLGRERQRTLRDLGIEHERAERGASPEELKQLRAQKEAQEARIQALVPSGDSSDEWVEGQAESRTGLTPGPSPFGKLRERLERVRMALVAPKGPLQSGDERSRGLVRKPSVLERVDLGVTAARDEIRGGVGDVRAEVREAGAKLRAAPQEWVEKRAAKRREKGKKKPGFFGRLTAKIRDVGAQPGAARATLREAPLEWVQKRAAARGPRKPSLLERMGAEVGKTRARIRAAPQQWVEARVDQRLGRTREDAADLDLSGLEDTLTTRGEQARGARRGGGGRTPSRRRGGGGAPRPRPRLERPPSPLGGDQRRSVLGRGPEQTVLRAPDGPPAPSATPGKKKRKKAPWEVGHERQRPAPRRGGKKPPPWVSTKGKGRLDAKERFRILEALYVMYKGGVPKDTKKRSERDADLERFWSRDIDTRQAEDLIRRAMKEHRFLKLDSAKERAMLAYRKQLIDGVSPGDEEQVDQPGEVPVPDELTAESPLSRDRSDLSLVSSSEEQTFIEQLREGADLGALESSGRLSRTSRGEPVPISGAYEMQTLEGSGGPEERGGPRARSGGGRGGVRSSRRTGGAPGESPPRGGAEERTAPAKTRRGAGRREGEITGERAQRMGQRLMQRLRGKDPPWKKKRENELGEHQLLEALREMVTGTPEARELMREIQEQLEDLRRASRMRTP